MSEPAILSYGDIEMIMHALNYYFGHTYSDENRYALQNKMFGIHADMLKKLRTPGKTAYASLKVTEQESDLLCVSDKM